ncbi:unnamed protein product, partial [marine sediment metagenome]
IGNAWLAQYRGRGWISRAIQYATGGPHSHSAMLRRNPASVDVLELREFHGGRVRPLRAEVAKHPGRIDLFSPNACERWSGNHYDDPASDWDAAGAVHYMELLAKLPYGYRSVLRIALRQAPLIWRLYPIETCDVICQQSRQIRPFCSHAVALALRLGGHVDCVPRLPDYLTTPNDLTHSLFFRYEFTLEP